MNFHVFGLNVSAMKILLSEGAMTALTRLGGYVIESRGHINVKVRTFMHALPRFNAWPSNESAC